MEDNGLTITYMGDNTFEGYNTWGEYLHVEFEQKKLTKEFTQELRNNPRYIEDRNPTSPDKTVFVFEFTEDEKRKIVQPFLDGQYDKIDRKYVKENYSKYYDGVLSMNYSILYKIRGPHTTGFWEDLMGAEIPEGQQVWPRPEKEDEILGFSKTKTYV